MALNTKVDFIGTNRSNVLFDLYVRLFDLYVRWAVFEPSPPFVQNKQNQKQKRNEMWITIKDTEIEK